MSNFKIGIFNLPEPMSNLEGVRYAHEAGFAAFEPFPQHDLAQPDRETAIRMRVEQAREGDIILLAGKGHENNEIDRTGKHPFCEKDIAVEAAKKYHALPDEGR